MDITLSALIGTLKTYFKIGNSSDGVRLKSSSSVLQVRSYDDSADSNLKAALVQLSGGSPGAGKFLQSDASGNGSWAAIPWATPGALGATTPANVTADLYKFAASTELTESSDAVTVTQSYHTIKAETGTTDNLATINGGSGVSLLVLQAKSGHTITVKNGTGNIFLNSAADFSMSGDKSLILFYDGTNWSDGSALGSLSGQNSNAVSITGGTIDGTTIGATTPSTGAFTSLVVAVSGTSLTNVFESDGGAATIRQDVYGTNQSLVLFRKAKGTKASPTAVVTNDVLGAFIARGQISTTPGDYSGNTCQFRFLAAENFSSTNQGTRFELFLTPIGLTTAFASFSIAPNSQVYTLRDTSTNSVPIIAYVHTTSGTPATGIGLETDWRAPDSAGVSQNILVFTTTLPTVTSGGHKGRATMSVGDSGATREIIRLEGSGTAGMLSFFGAAAVVQQVDGAALTNNVTSGGTTDTIANYTDLSVYANDAAAIRNNLYQLARKVKIIDDALRSYALLT